MNASVVVVEWVLCTVACLVLLVRLYVRMTIVKVGVTLEDTFLVIAQLLFFCWISMDTFTNSRGFMQKDLTYFTLPQPFNPDPRAEVTVLKVVYASSIPYYISLWFIKYGLLAFYYKLIPTGTKARIFLHITAAISLAASIVIIFLNLFLCQPISLNWKLSQTGEQCYSSTSTPPFLISVVLNLIADILIFFLPFPLLKHLKVGRRAKYGLIATFSLGVITIAVVVIRAVVSALTGKIAQVAILTAVECFTSMVVACLPALRPLLKLFNSRRMGHRTQSQAQFAKHEPGHDEDDDDFSDDNDSDDEDDIRSIDSYRHHGQHAENTRNSTSMSNYESTYRGYTPQSYRMSTIEKSDVDSSVTTLTGVSTPPVTQLSRNPSNRNPAVQRFNGYVPKRQDQDFGFDDGDAQQFDQRRHSRQLSQHQQPAPQFASQFIPPRSPSRYDTNSMAETLDSNPSISMEDHSPAFSQRHAHGASMYMSSPLPPPPNANEDDYIMPSYILNEPLPNPVI